MPAKTARRHAAKCSCGCGQAPAETTRLRKSSCPCGASIVRLSRQALAIVHATCGECGDDLAADCLYDRTCSHDAHDAAAAHAAIETRELDRMERSTNYARRALGQHRCGNDACKAYVPFGANVDPTAEPVPCARCGSTLPARFVPRNLAMRFAGDPNAPRDRAGAPMPF